MIRESREAIGQIGYAFELFARSLRHLPTVPRQLSRIIEQCFLIGYLTMPMVAIMSFFIGGVLALQTAHSLTSIQGTERFLGPIVGLSICRELGPVMAAFLLVGRAGSAITAELASMKVYQEVDFLVTANIPPERLLVLPRLLAAAIMMPALTIIAILVGWFGGQIVSGAVDFISLSPDIYWRELKAYVTFDDVIDGLIKAEVFAVVCVLVSCSVGLGTRGGPREVGLSVTRAVVMSMVLVLILDYFITKITL